jgi:hypothetical protein
MTTKKPQEHLPKKYIDSRDFEDRFDLPRGTAAQMRYHGKGPVFLRIGKRIRYDLDDINSWAQEQRFARTDTRA